MLPEFISVTRNIVLVVIITKDREGLFEVGLVLLFSIWPLKGKCFSIGYNSDFHFLLFPIFISTAAPTWF